MKSSWREAAWFLVFNELHDFLRIRYKRRRSERMEKSVNNKQHIYQCCIKNGETYCKDWNRWKFSILFPFSLGYRSPRQGGIATFGLPRQLLPRIKLIVILTENKKKSIWQKESFIHFNRFVVLRATKRQVIDWGNRLYPLINVIVVRIYSVWDNEILVVYLRMCWICLYV